MVTAAAARVAGRDAVVNPDLGEQRSELQLDGLAAHQQECHHEPYRWGHRNRPSSTRPSGRIEQERA